MSSYAEKVRLEILTAYDLVDAPWMHPRYWGGVGSPESPEHRACRLRADEEQAALTDEED